METTVRTVWIGGQATTTETSFNVVNPATGLVFAQAPSCTPKHIDQAVGAAENAFLSWGKAPQERTDALRECANRLRDHQGELAKLVTTEMGKPIAKSQEEAFVASMLFDAAADLSLDAQLVAEQPSHVVMHRRPLGVVAAIAPWNWPIGLAMWAVTSALKAGNCVVLKPSPFAPLSSLRIGELLSDVLPAGVFSVLTGNDDVGRNLVSDHRIRKVSFTGSVSSGLDIAQTCASDLKRVTLEMGGNDAAIVLDDADVDAICEDLFWGAFNNSGQICLAIKRLYVHESIAEKLLDALCERAQRTVLGDPLDPKTELGPLGNQRQLEIVESLVSQARSDGGVVRAGGHRLDQPGFFYAPTLVSNLPDESPLVADEQFGPALPILTFSDVDDAIHRANATRFGLGGSIWTDDAARGQSLAAQLEVGTAWVNQHFVLDSPAPFGGWKHSGIGRANGIEGLHEYTETQVISVGKGKQR